MNNPLYSREQVEIALGILSGRIDPEHMWFDDKVVLFGDSEQATNQPDYAIQRQAERIMLDLLLPMNDLFVIICGASGSGKSTYVKSLLATKPDMACVWPDQLRLEVCGDESCQDKNGFIFGTLLPIRVNGLRALRKGCIIDATSTTKKARKALIDHARQVGYTRIECHVVRCDEATCQARNAARARIVPRDVIVRQFAQWQEPTLDEGFDEIVEIALDAPPQST